MAEDLGTIDFQIQADERQWLAVHRKAGQVSGRAIMDVMRNGLRRMGSAAVGAVAGGRGRGVFDLAVAGAAGRGAGRIAGGAGRVAGAAAGAAAGIPGAGLIIGAVIVGLGALVFAVRKAIKSLVALSQATGAEAARLRAVSPQLSAVAAVQMIGQLQRDLRTSRLVGPALAGVELRKERLRNILAPLKDFGRTLKAGAAFGATLVLERLALAGNLLLRGFNALNQMIAAVLFRVARILTFFGGPGIAAGAAVMAIATELGNVNKNLSKIAAHMRDLEAKGAIVELNKIMTQGITDLTGGKWVFPGTAAPQPVRP